MHKVYLLLGGNLGNRYFHLSEATKQIEKNIGKIVDCSSFYETEPWGFEHKNNFLNQVIAVNSLLQPREILQETQKIEAELGRVRISTEYTARNIDIDILFYDNLILDESDLKIPHPQLHNRNFTLVPLNEINPVLVHPVFKKKITELLSTCNDSQEVWKITTDFNPKTN